MAVMRVRFVFVLFLCFTGIVGKPIFENLLCEYFCDDNDSSDSSSDEFLDALFGCSACTPKTQAPTTLAPTTIPIGASQAQNNASPMLINIQPGTAFNLTMGPGPYSWFSVMSNGMAPVVNPSAAPDTTTAAAASSSASAATTAAPASTAAAA